MTSKPIFPFFWSLLLSAGCLFQASAQTTLPAALDQLRSLLRTVTDQVELKEEQFTLLTNDNTGAELSGTATVFNLQNIAIKATLGNSLTGIEMEFPKGITNTITISGQKLSTWVPTFLQDKLELTKVVCQFFPQDNNRLSLQATLESGSSTALVQYNGFQISNQQVIVGLERSNTSLFTATLGGKLALGGLGFNLSGAANSNREWSLVGSLDNLKVIELIRNAGQWLGITVPPMPSVLENYKI
jgi:hypothetical protein